MKVIVSVIFRTGNAPRDMMSTVGVTVTGQTSTPLPRVETLADTTPTADVIITQATVQIAIMR